MTFALLCAVTLGGLAWWVMTPRERTRLRQTAEATLQQAAAAASVLRRRPEPLAEMLRGRTPVPVVTPMLVAGYLAVYLGVLLSSDDAALVRWGASVGPLTTNGEWWRLLSSSFVHEGVLHLVVNLVALISVGLVLERLAGSVGFAAVYLAAALMGGVAGLASSPVTVVAGGSAAIFGLYGFALASWAWGTAQQSTSTIRVSTVARLTPAAAAFVVYHTAGGGVPGPGDQMGIATGFACGLALARCLRLAKPPVRRIALTAAVTACLAIASAVPLRGLTDIRPEIERLVALDGKHAGAYKRAVAEFTRGTVTRLELVELIEGTILRELEAPKERLRTFDRVPPEHRPLIAAAEHYLKLREEGWRVRLSGLRASSTQILRAADELEQAALTALHSIDH